MRYSVRSSGAWVARPARLLACYASAAIILLVASSPAWADYDSDDSPEFTLDLLSLDPGDAGDWADSGEFMLDLTYMNRAWSDSEETTLVLSQPLTVVVHGFVWQSPSDDPPDWAYDMCDDIEAQNAHLSAWPFSWKAQSNNFGSGWCIAAGEHLAALLARRIESDDIGHLHLIGHSLGTMVSSEAAKRLLWHGYSVDHVTYLDTVDGDVVIAGVFEHHDNPLVDAWAGVTRVEHYYGNGWAPFADFSGWLDPVAGAWNVGPDIPGFEAMGEYGHNEINEVYYADTIVNTENYLNGWYYSLLGGAWTSENGRPGYRAPVDAPPTVFNGDFGTGNDAGYTWQEEIAPGLWQNVDGFLRASIQERPDAPENSAGLLGIDGNLASEIAHQDIIVPSDAHRLWVQVSENLGAGSVFVVKLDDVEIGRIDYAQATSTDFHFVVFDMRPVASHIGKLRFLLDGTEPGQVWIDNIDIEPCMDYPVGDLDHDCWVGFNDYGIFVATMLGPSRWITNTEADLDGDGDCDLSDFALFQGLAAEPN